MTTPRVITLSRRDTMPDLSGPVAAGIWGAVHRATTGLRTFDTSYNEHFQMAADAGMLWGASHLGDNSNAQQQALSFVNWAMRAPLLVLEYDHPPISPDGDRTMPPDVMVSFLRCIENYMHRKAWILSGDLLRQTLPTLSDADQSYVCSHRLWLKGDPTPPAGFNFATLLQDTAGNNTFEGTRELLEALWKDGVLT